MDMCTASCVNVLLKEHYSMATYFTTTKSSPPLNIQEGAGFLIIEYTRISDDTIHSPLLISGDFLSVERHSSLM